MHSRFHHVLAALAAAFLLLVLGAAPAGAIPVKLRIEGKDRTIFEGQIDTDGHSVDGHRCDGTNNGAEKDPGPTVIAALDDGTDEGNYGWDGKWFPDFEDFLVSRIGPDEQSDSRGEYWGYLLNYKEGTKGGCQQRVHSGDEVLWAYDAFDKTALKLSAPSTVEINKDFTVRVVDGANDNGIGGARVEGQESNGDGDITLRFDSPGRHTLKATRDDSIRSNEQAVCAYRPGQNDCGQTATTPFAGPITGPLVSQIVGVTPARRFTLALAPRTLRGQVASGGVPLSALRVRLRRYQAGRCSHYSLRLRRFHPSRCVLPYFFYAVTPSPTGAWSLVLPARLLAGTYTLEAEAVDAAGRRSRGRVVFYVTAPAR